MRRARAEAATPAFGRLLLVQAAGAAGDALVAVALAGSLFFSVPETTARTRVLLYLLLTMAPFAIVAPLLSRWLDRHGSALRAALAGAALGRGMLAWALSTRLDSLLLFPLAFAVLVLSRAALVARGAALPSIAPEGRTLVRANAALSKASALAGMIAVPIGLLVLRVAGEAAELRFAGLVYIAGVVPALALPLRGGRVHLEDRIHARATARTMTVRQAAIAVGGMRFLVGFLVFHLAFALRREEFTSLGLGALVASAAAGALLGAVVSPWLRRRVREEGILLIALAAAGVSGVLVGAWFSIVTAALLVATYAVASGAAKVAFDAIVQRDISAEARGWAFARFEAVLQLAWVLGALIPVAVAIGSAVGVVGAGVVANLFGILFVLGRHRVRGSALP